MGGSCTKLVAVKTQVHSNAAFHTNVQSIPPSEDDQNDDHSRINLDKDNDSQDVFSTGDHDRQNESKETVEDKCTLTDNNIPCGDCKSERNDENKISQQENDVTKATTMLRLEETNDPDVNNEDKTTQATGSNRSVSTLVQVETVSRDGCSEKDSSSNSGLRDLNANSRHDICGQNKGEHYPKTLKIEVRSGEGDGDDNVQTNSETLEDSRNRGTNSSLEQGDRKSSSSESQGEEPELCEVQTLIQDSLFFFPVQVDKSRPVTPHRVPDRLQNRPRKPPLSYNERMLLADLNRFEQLDKRREFAAKRNRSIPRNGKLPKINTNKDDNDEEGSNSQSNIDD